MSNILDLKPGTPTGDLFYEAKWTLPAWAGFQSRRGPYGSVDQQGQSGGDIRVMIDGVKSGGDKVVSQAQVNAIHYLDENQSGIRDAILARLLAEYENLKKIYEEHMPEIGLAEDFKANIGLAIVLIMPAEKDGYAYTGFEFGCTWDDEHGAGVMAHKDRVIETGNADTAFNHWVTYEDNGTKEAESRRWNEQHAHLAKEIEERKKQALILPEQREEIVVAKRPWWKFW